MTDWKRKNPSANNALATDINNNNKQKQKNDLISALLAYTYTYLKHMDCVADKLQRDVNANIRRKYRDIYLI